MLRVLAILAALAVLTACEKSTPTESAASAAQPRATLSSHPGANDTLFVNTAFIVKFADGNELQFVTTGTSGGVIVAGKVNGVVSNLAFAHDGQVSVAGNSFEFATDSIGFFNWAPFGPKPVITGSRQGNMALSGLLAKLSAMGLIANNTTN